MEQRFLACNHHTQSAKILRDDPVAEGDLHHNELISKGVMLTIFMATLG